MSKIMAPSLVRANDLLHKNTHEALGLATEMVSAAFEKYGEISEEDQPGLAILIAAARVAMEAGKELDEDSIRELVHVCFTLGRAYEADYFMTDHEEVV